MDKRCAARACRASRSRRRLPARPAATSPGWCSAHGVDGVAAEAAKYAPVIVVDSPALEHPMAEPFARAIAAVVRQRQFDLVSAAASTFAKDILPRAAALLGGAMASDVVRHELVDGRLSLRQPAVCRRGHGHAPPHRLAADRHRPRIRVSGRGKRIEQASPIERRRAGCRNASPAAANTRA